MRDYSKIPKKSISVVKFNTTKVEAFAFSSSYMIALDIRTIGLFMRSGIEKAPNFLVGDR